jgi:hypothetical protein
MDGTAAMIRAVRVQAKSAKVKISDRIQGNYKTTAARLRKFRAMGTERRKTGLAAHT